MPNDDKAATMSAEVPDSKKRCASDRGNRTKAIADYRQALALGGTGMNFDFARAALQRLGAKP
jgi:hypothetical protein